MSFGRFGKADRRLKASGTLGDTAGMDEPEKNTPAALPRLLRWLTIIALAVTAAVRIYWAWTGPLDEDEPDVLQKAWQIDRGAVKYLDFFGIRPPLAFQAMRPLLWMFDKPSSVIIAGRAMQLLLDVAVFAFLYLFAARALGRRAACWTLLLVSGFNFFAFRTAQVRPEPLMLALLFAGLWIVADRHGRASSTGRLFPAGLLLGLAVMTKPTALFAALAVFLVLVIEARRRRPPWRGLLFFIAGGLTAGLAVMFWTCGPRLFTAMGWMLDNRELLRFTEGRFGFSDFVLRTFWTNPIFWPIGAAGFIALHFRRLARLEYGPSGGETNLLLLLGWSSLVGLIARQSPFEQDFIFPGLIFAMAGGALLAGQERLVTASRSWRRSWPPVLLLLAVIGPFIYETYTAKMWEKTTLSYYRTVIASFWNLPEPPNDETTVDVQKLARYLAGPHGRIHYHPVRTLRQSLALADLIADRTSPAGVVLTQSGLGIKRAECHLVEKSAVFARFMSYEGSLDSPACRSLRRFAQDACDSAATPGRRMLNVLIKQPPDLIVFHYGPAEVIVREFETRRWFASHYRAWYDPPTGAFLAAPLAP